MSKNSKTLADRKERPTNIYLSALPVSDQQARNVKGTFSTPSIKQNVMQQDQNFNFHFRKPGLVESEEKRVIRPRTGFEKNIRYAPMTKCSEVGLRMR